ncbi:MAG: DEAD/DEAH box helicase [Actinomycetaceae bacterium]|nr:DEAD/DEAH box helicase [Actinomycetaceae bacterium]
MHNHHESIVRIWLAKDQLIYAAHVDGNSGNYEKWPGWVCEEVKAAFGHVELPYAHQVKSFESIRQGNHTVISTGTGSGKSLSAWIPIVNHLVEYHKTPPRLSTFSRKPKVLYMSPTKALAMDQWEKMQAVSTRLPHSFVMGACDGDTPKEVSYYLSKTADIIFSNPDYIHHSMLGNFARWQSFLQSLHYIVIDEFHHYKGLFGAHVALIVRRLVRLARLAGVNPTVIFLSATIDSPDDVVKKFLGVRTQCVVIDKDESRQSGKTLMFIRPRAVIDKIDTNEGPSKNSSPKQKDMVRRNSHVEAGELTGVLIDNNARLLTFVRSRHNSERVTQIAQNYLSETDTSPSRIATYRGGYLASERRELEKSIKNGQLQGLVTTSALEMGIDINSLDCVIVTGWPGTYASFKQQIGRCGRGEADGLAIFIAGDNPLEHYILDHAEEYVNGKNKIEAQVFDIKNPHVYIPHICCAAREHPLSEKDFSDFDIASPSILHQLVEQNLLVKVRDSWVWNGRLPIAPHELVQVRGSSGTVRIIEKDTQKLLGTVDEGAADRTVFPGAVYVHRGKKYRVEMLEENQAVVSVDTRSMTTYPRDVVSIDVREVARQQEFPGGIMSAGNIRVKTRVTGYDMRDEITHTHEGFVQLNMPERILETQGFWFALTNEVLNELGVDKDMMPGALHGAEHAMIGMLPLLAGCDRWDLGGLSTALHIYHGLPTIFVYDGASGGAGFSYHGFDVAQQWCAATLERVRSCECVQGCPQCIQSPKCGNNNSPLSKKGAVQILGYMTIALSHL